MRGERLESRKGRERAVGARTANRWLGYITSANGNELSAMYWLAWFDRVGKRFRFCLFWETIDILKGGARTFRCITRRARIC